MSLVIIWVSTMIDSRNSAGTSVGDAPLDHAPSHFLHAVVTIPRRFAYRSQAFPLVEVFRTFVKGEPNLFPTSLCLVRWIAPESLMEDSSMRVLVTGAAGFLGRHVAQRLLDDGFDVTGLDVQVPDQVSIPIVAGDLTDRQTVLNAARGHEVLCHIGAIGDVYLAASDPSLAAAVNVTGSANVASAAAEVGARVVYASTWEVYGAPHYEPIDEEHPCEPDHPYNITKLAGERILIAADRMHDVPVLALRLGTAYGSGLRPNSVFRIFIDRARRGEPITIQGDGSQSRQFTHAFDIAHAFSLACRSELRGLAINITARDPVSIKQLAELITGRYSTEVRYGQARPGDVVPAMVSPNKAAELLGWEAEVGFEDGLTELMDAAESDQ
jgi:UDP-glucose 4-epimerase